MKKPIVILFAILLSVFACNAQDIIVLKTGEEIKATVTEVGISEVKYKKFGFEGGPVYLQLKSNIARIKYANGSEDIFSMPEKATTVTVQPETSVPAIEDVDHHAHTIYAEALGNSLIWSLNYDTRFGRKRNGIGARVGIGYTAFGRGSSYLTAPVMANYLFGKNSSFFELGLGGIIYVSDDDFLWAEESTVVGTLTMGYRLQPKNGGIMFKVALTPFFGVSGGRSSFNDEFYFWPFYGGFSFGYAF